MGSEELPRFERKQLLSELEVWMSPVVLRKPFAKGLEALGRRESVRRRIRAGHHSSQGGVQPGPLFEDWSTEIRITRILMAAGSVKVKRELKHKGRPLAEAKGKTMTSPIAVYRITRATARRMKALVIRNSMANAHLGNRASQTANARISAVLTPTPMTMGSLTAFLEEQEGHEGDGRRSERSEQQTGSADGFICEPSLEQRDASGVRRVRDDGQSTAGDRTRH